MTKKYALEEKVTGEEIRHCRKRLGLSQDEKNRDIEIVNYTGHLLKRAFGKIENPSYEQYEEFLKSRCFPPTRDKMKLVLREYDIPFYDPMLIIEKTQGRMAEDDFWIRIER